MIKKCTSILLISCARYAIAQGREARDARCGWLVLQANIQRKRARKASQVTGADKGASIQCG